MEKVLAVLVLFFCITGTAFAITFTQEGAIVKLSYTEPTTNSDGTALNDLKHCSIYFTDGAQTAKIKDIPASKPEGGGEIQTEIEIETQGEITATFWATATDTSNNESIKSNTITIKIDKLAPCKPQ